MSGKKMVRTNQPKRMSLRELKRITIPLMWMNKPIKALQVVMTNRRWSKKRSLRWLLELPKMPQHNGNGPPGKYKDAYKKRPVPIDTSGEEE